MFDWFWEMPVMVTLQSWVDSTRALPIDPIWTLIGFIAIGLGLVAWFSHPTTRDHKLPGSNYRGGITPKTINKMLVTPKRKRLLSRKQMEEDLRKARAARRKAEAQNDDD
ncbi:MAG: hypothetical protein AAFV27_01730 [Pseudomonadota bacterium]